jgi:hypothetical protein
VANVVTERAARKWKNSAPQEWAGVHLAPQMAALRSLVNSLSRRLVQKAPIRSGRERVGRVREFGKICETGMAGTDIQGFDGVAAVQ